MTTWIPDVITHEPIESEWGNLIRDRTATPFPNVAARTAAILTPKAGMVSWLTDQKRLEVYDGAVWVPIAPVVRNYLGNIVANNTGGAWNNVDLDIGVPVLVEKLYCPYRMTVRLGGWVSTSGIYNFNIRDQVGGSIDVLPPGQHFQGSAAGGVAIPGLQGAKDYAAGAGCGFSIYWVSTSVLYATVFARLELVPTAAVLLERDEPVTKDEPDELEPEPKEAT